MATGGEEFGDGKTPILENTDDRGDDADEEQEVNRTQPFQPGATSTPYNGAEQLEMKTMHHEKSGIPDISYTEETPLLGDFIHSDDKKSFLERKIEKIKIQYKNADFGKMNPIGLSKKSNTLEAVSFGPRGGESKIFKSGTDELLKSFIDKNLSALGPRTEEIIAEDRDTIGEERQRLKETEKQLKQGEGLVATKEQLVQDVQELARKRERSQARLDEIHDEHGSNIEIETEVGRLKQVIKNYETEEKTKEKELASVLKKLKNKEILEDKAKRQRAIIAEKQRKINDMQEKLNQTKTVEYVKEQISEMNRQKAEYEAVIQDENASPSDKEAAQDGLADINEELPRLQTQIAEREMERPLSERVKEIFKKYGVTVTSVFLAAGVTIGVVLSTVTNALKASTKALGKGLKDIGAKLSSLLPGLIGSVANFLFKAAGQAVGFLAEHTWLLILAVVAFLFEKNLKKRS